jgi:hypothetical protein
MQTPEETKAFCSRESCLQIKADLLNHAFSPLLFHPAIDMISTNLPVEVQSFGINLYRCLHL